jgi:hypothetical protein
MFMHVLVNCPNLWERTVYYYKSVTGIIQHKLLIPVTNNNNNNEGEKKVFPLHTVKAYRRE